VCFHAKQMVVPLPNKTTKRYGSFEISSKTEIVLNTNARKDNGILKCIRAIQRVFKRLSSDQISLEVTLPIVISITVIAVINMSGALM